MSDIVQASVRVLGACVLAETTLIYGLIWLSDWFGLYAPLWVVWTVMGSPPAMGILGVLGRVLWANVRRADNATMAGAAR